MSEFFKQLIGQLASIWSRLSLQQKIITSALVFFTLFGMFGLIVWSQNGGNRGGDAGFKVLYSNLALDEAADITDELSQSRFQYKFDNNGKTVLVPAKQLYEARIALAREGLPKSRGLGYEIFDKTSFGMTDFVQKLNAHRALEGELRRTMEGLDEVISARVHIVVPEETIFLDKQKAAKASVVIQCKSGRTLSKDQIRGISYLVSSSVDGLVPQNVSIVDYEGRLLTSPFADDQTALFGSHNMELQQNIEKNLENKAATMLAGILGPSKAYVKVAVDLDFDRVERTMEQYNPESRVIRSEERVDENTKNAPDGDNARERSLTNYEIDKTVQHIIQEVGNVKRLTISVAVDGKYSKDEEDKMIYAPRTADEMQSIEEIIKNAVGYNLARGDQIAVSQVQFDNEFMRNEQFQMARRDRMELYLTIAKYVAGVIIALLLLLFLRMIARTVVEAMNPPVPAIEKFGIVEDTPEELPEEIRESSMLLEQIETMSREEPTNIASIIRQWLSEPSAAHRKQGSE